MFDKSLLRAEMILNKITATQLANKLNISKSTLSKKMNGKSDFALCEIQAISDLLGFEETAKIFFTK